MDTVPPGRHRVPDCAQLCARRRGRPDHAVCGLLELIIFRSVRGKHTAADTLTVYRVPSALVPVMDLVAVGWLT